MVASVELLVRRMSILSSRVDGNFRVGLRIG